eukprot:5941316-Prymnesium_polylepis.1
MSSAVPPPTKAQLTRRPSFERPTAQQNAQMLINAAGSSRPDAAVIVARMLNMGVPPNCSDTAGFTPLALASRTGNLAVVRSLLQRGADPLISSKENRNPPLFWAAAGNHIKVLEALLDAKAAADQRNIAGDTALLWACRSGAADAAALLLGACPSLLNLQNNQLMSAIICTCAGKHAHILRVLLASAQPPPQLDLADSNGRAALHFAAVGSAEC